MGDTVTAYEYPVMDKTIHGAVIEISGRYPKKGSVVNEKCTELGYVIKGNGKLVVNGKEYNFKPGDQVIIKAGEKYYWDANATLFMPCTPAWYPEQHREIN